MHARTNKHPALWHMWFNSSIARAWTDVSKYHLRSRSQTDKIATQHTQTRCYLFNTFVTRSLSATAPDYKYKHVNVWMWMDAYAWMQRSPGTRLMNMNIYFDGPAHRHCPATYRLVLLLGALASAFFRSSRATCMREILSSQRMCASRMPVRIARSIRSQQRNAPHFTNTHTALAWCCIRSIHSRDVTPTHQHGTQTRNVLADVVCRMGREKRNLLAVGPRVAAN